MVVIMNFAEALFLSVLVVCATLVAITDGTKTSEQKTEQVVVSKKQQD